MRRLPVNRRVVCDLCVRARVSYTETVEVSRQQEAPSFTKKLESAEVFEGTPVRLECDVTGFPQPQVTWYQVRERGPFVRFLLHGLERSAFLLRSNALTRCFCTTLLDGCHSRPIVIQHFCFRLLFLALRSYTIHLAVAP